MEEMYVPRRVDGRRPRVLHSPMNRISPALLGVAGVALAAAASLTAAPPAPATAAEATRTAADVLAGRVYIDTAGPGKDIVLVRSRSRYRYTGATAGEHWFGVTTVTLRGPGGTKTVRDADRLRQPAHGEVVEHRVLIGRREAARILGPDGARAKVRVRARAHLELRANAQENGLAAAPGAGNGSLGGNGGAGGNAGLLGSGASGDWTPAAGNGSTGGVPLVTTERYPPVTQSWGGGAFSVEWTWDPPYRPFAAALVVHLPASATVASAELQVDYDANGMPLSGFVTRGNTFTMQSSTLDAACGPGEDSTVWGRTPPRWMGESFSPTIPARVGWTVLNCGGPFTQGPQDYSPDFVDGG